MSKSTQQFEEKCKAFFSKADKDRSGCLSIQEFREVIKGVLDRKDLSDRTIAEMFAGMDDDGDKSMSWEEFSEIIKTKPPKAVQVPELMEVFQKCDKDGSGRLTQDEIRKAFTKLGITSDPEESLKAVDADSDGKVSMDEFIEFWINCQK